ncbi:MAG: alpha/beta hydrolase [Draconibacterium sp.]|nr:alpha/beta hydrolase [Draconibacterium sp.]
MKILTVFFILLSISTNLFSQEKEIIQLWPDKVPGETEAKQKPAVTDNKKGDVTRITDITDPAIVVFPASKENSNGAGIIVCPGGGYNILAIDKEGYEVAEWLNSLGFSAFVLQYRVPKKQEGALQDAQRAIRFVRNNSKKWRLNPDQIGIMGFSAGGSLSARASTLYEKNTYDKVDNIDEISCKPNFALLIYPAYLDRGENRSLTPELKVNQQTPPMFIFGTADDRVGNSSLVFTQAMRDAKVPVELHFLPTGGHGYGLRPGNIAAETWPPLAAKWLENIVETSGK